MDPRDRGRTSGGWVIPIFQESPYDMVRSETVDDVTGVRRTDKSVSHTRKRDSGGEDGGRAGT